MQQKRIADKLNIMAGVVCAVGIISSLVIAIALFASAGDKDSMVNYLSGNKINGGMIVAGLVVLVLGIIFALLAYYLIRGFAVIVRHYEEDGSEVQGENFFEKLSQVGKNLGSTMSAKVEPVVPVQEQTPEKEEVKVRYCFKCGSEIRGNARFCSKCGAVLVDNFDQ